MTDLVKRAKISYIVISCMMIVLGTVLIAVPQIGSNIVCYILGGTAILFGAAKIVGYLSKDLFRLAFQFDLSLGILLMLLGTLVICFANALYAVLPYIFGVYAIIDGIAKLQISIDAKRFGFRHWWTLVLLAIATSVAGVLSITYDLLARDALLIWLGILLICDGIENLCTVIYTVKVFKNCKKIINEDENVVDEDVNIIDGDDGIVG